MRTALPILLLCALGVASCGKDHTLRPSAPVGNEVLFESTRDGVSDLYAAMANGSGLHRITRDSLQDYQARWSPDGSRVVFIHQYAGESTNVTVIGANGTGELRLTHDYKDAHPSWSPDGSKIAYMHDPGYVAGQLWTMNADGSSPHLLIDTDSLAGATEVSWTPQGDFVGADYFGLVRFNSDGSGRTRFTTMVGLENAHPRVSPDGSKVAFAWNGGSGGNTDIYVVDADGGNVQQLTTLGNASMPVWSASGTKIGFVSELRMWSMNLDGSDAKLLPVKSPAPGGDFLSDWR